MKDKVAAFFDSAAENWDKANDADPAVLEKITDIAGVSEQKSVLDVGCGTGIMLPLYLGRRAGRITAVDISENMLGIAEKKFPCFGIDFVCADIVSFPCEEKFDCVITHNAFPHFLEQEKALARLKALTAPGGRLTIAHSISREDVIKCHENVPDISFVLPEASVLAESFGDGFENFTVISDDICYIVSAAKKK